MSALNDHSLDQNGLTFGPFRLLVEQRALLKEGVPIEIGSRALDILIALVERAGEIVPQRDLITRVWGGLVVEDANLRVHISQLRRILDVQADAGRHGPVPERQGRRTGRRLLRGLDTMVSSR